MSNLQSKLEGVVRRTLPVSRKQAEAAHELGIPVVKTAFLKHGQHAQYAVHVDDLPEYMLANLMGARRQQAITRPTQARATSANTVLQYTGQKVEFKANSARADLYDLVRIYAKEPIYRHVLLDQIRKYSDAPEKTITGTIANFIHDLNILKVVE